MHGRVLVKDLWNNLPNKCITRHCQINIEINCMTNRNKNMQVNKLGKKVIVAAENIGLIIIAIATIIAVSIEINAMFTARTVTLADLLLLFIYLEVLAMVAIYLDSGKLPIRIPLYIAIVALARYLILDMKNMDVWHMLAVSGAILIITIAILVHRYGHSKYPYKEEDIS